MTGMKRILVLLVLLAVSFAASLGLNLLVVPGPSGAPRAAAPTAAATQPAGEGILSAVPILQQLDQLRPRERQLEELVRELRSKVAECRMRKRRLDEREKRLDMARELLKKDAQDLENLRFQLVGPLARLKEAQATLEQTRILIAKEERDNLKRTAAIYEKMDANSGSQILAEMCANKQERDATKILYLMSERAAAKLLAQMPDRGLAAKLSEQIKRIRQEG